MQRLTNEELDALEAALAGCPEGRWKWNYASSGRIQVSASRHARQICAVWNSTAYPADKLANVIVDTHNALPALLAELRELRRLTTPEPIGEKHRDGNWWLVWEPGFETWFKARWRHEAWDLCWQNLLGTPTHALPLPGMPEPPAARGE
jgi:hypothetical protein